MSSVREDTHGPTHSSRSWRTDFVPSTLPSSSHVSSHLICPASLGGNVPAPGWRPPTRSPTPRPAACLVDGEIVEPLLAHDPCLCFSLRSPCAQHPLMQRPPHMHAHQTLWAHGISGIPSGSQEGANGKYNREVQRGEPLVVNSDQ